MLYKQNPFGGYFVYGNSRTPLFSGHSSRRKHQPCSRNSPYHPPTLSRQIAQLEEDVGVKLFHRGSRRITLTNEGILLRRRAEEILSLVDRTKQELNVENAFISGKIIIGGGELAAVKLLPQVIRHFNQLYPLVTYELYTANADLIKEYLEKGLIDIGILLEPIDIEKFDFIRLNQLERWVVLMRPDDPLTGKSAVSADDLKDQSVILPRRSNLQNELSSWFGIHFQDLHILFTSNLTTNAALMVEQGLGYAIVIEGSLPFWDPTKLTYRPLKPALLASSVFAWKKGQPSSPAVTQFIQHLQETYSQKA